MENNIEIINNNLSQEEYVKSLSTTYGVDTENGLSTEEAKIRLAKYGPNAIKSDATHSWVKVLVHQFKDLLNIMLLLIAIVDFIFIHWLPKSDIAAHIIQGVVLFIIVGVNMTLGTIQEVKANKALDALQKASSPKAKVVRDNKQVIILTSELVVGDVVLLEEGSIVPGDVKLFQVNSLKIDESALTGESLPVEKDCSRISNDKTPIGDRSDCAFASTIITYGSAIGVVYATGMQTEMGKIATLLNTSSKTKELPPLKKKINRLTKTLTYCAFGLLAFMLILNGILYYSHYYPSWTGITTDNSTFNFWINIDTWICTIALAISLIPVALPVTTTVILAASVTKMAKNNALCKELTIVEALGNANIICSDKTGTLTLNKMTVTTICNYDDIVEKNNRTPEYIKENIATYKHLVSIGMFCNNAEIDVQENTAIGDPTEIALLYLGENTDLNIDKTRNKYKRVFEQPFDSDRKMMTTVYATKTGYTSFTKGAAEAILDLCDSINTKDGIRDITTADRNLIKKYLNELSAKALRVLGLASRNFRSAPIKDSNYENQMVFEGLVGMIDPPRPEVFDAIKTCHEAGVGVAMITGDHQITALAIARELGIVDENETYTLTGTQLDEMSDNQLKIAVQKCRVFARVSPDNKLQIVKAFKSNNLITGMTGDGTNDAPALKEADIGIAMGIGGTDVAKGAASVLLLDDNFTTIKGAINDGRKITRNMKNVISFILATNLATALFVVLFTYIFGFNTITVTQRLLLDLVTDTLPCIYIGLNPNDFGLMKQKPQIGNKLFDKRMLFEILINFLAIFSAVSLSFIFSYYAVGIRSEVVLDMICFITLSLSRILLSLNYVSHHNSLLKKIGRPYNGLYFACGVSIGLLLILSFVPGANIIAVGKPTDMFEPAKLFYTKDAAAWVYMLILPLLPLGANEVKKVITNKTRIVAKI